LIPGRELKKLREGDEEYEHQKDFFQSVQVVVGQVSQWMVTSEIDVADGVNTNGCLAIEWALVFADTATDTQIVTVQDTDCDGVIDNADNCPEEYNKLFRDVDFPDPPNYRDGSAEYWNPRMTAEWWVKEYKTSAKRHDMVLKRWCNDMQADFQCLALEGYTGERCNGVLVTVLQTPKVYIPKRTCKGCKGKFEFGSYMPSGQKYRCPMCGREQDLAAYKPKPFQMETYRLTALRSERRLGESLGWIIETAREMQEYMTAGMRTRRPNCRECVGDWWVCSYFEPHTQGLEAGEVGGFEQVEPLGYLE